MVGLAGRLVVRLAGWGLAGWGRGRGGGGGTAAGVCRGVCAGYLPLVLIT